MVAERRLARRIADVLVPLIMEEIVEIVKVVLQERISERIREHIVDVHVPRAVEQVTEVPKTSSRDRTLQYTAEQSLRHSAKGSLDAYDVTFSLTGYEPNDTVVNELVNS